MGYIQGDAGFESETRESRRGGRVAGLATQESQTRESRREDATNAGLASQEWQMRKRADSESTNPDPRQNNHIKNSQYKTIMEANRKIRSRNLNTQLSTYSGSGVLHRLLDIFLLHLQLMVPQLQI